MKIIVLLPEITVAVLKIIYKFSVVRKQITIPR